jgi:dsDNA-specific endonuclease/ATPase MutS2
MFQKSSPGLASKNLRISPAPNIVDLHIEKLVNDFQNMKNAEILELQLKTFEKYLDQAIASGLNEITFIHGAGNGILKNAIHKKLSKMSEIQFYQDAQKEKFGYGATLVGLK